MKKTLLLITTFFSWSAAQADTIKLDFIDNKFEDFMNRLLLSEQEKSQFSAYYGTICSKLKESEDVKKRLAEGYLYKVALDGLEKKHPRWHKALQPFISDPRITLDTEINNVRMFIGGFLIRYGAYEEFISKKVGGAKEENFFSSCWRTVKSYTVHAKNSIAGWFGFA